MRMLLLLPMLISAGMVSSGLSLATTRLDGGEVEPLQQALSVDRRTGAGSKHHLLEPIGGISQRDYGPDSGSGADSLSSSAGLDRRNKGSSAATPTEAGTAFATGGHRLPTWKWWRYHEMSEREILDHLVHRQRYDAREVPPAVGPLRINVSVAILSLEPTATAADITRSVLTSSEQSMTMRFSLDLLLHQSWFDPRLIHVDAQRALEPDSVGQARPYLNGIHHYRELWLPDVLVAGETRKRPDDMLTTSSANLALKIFGNGSVSFTIRHRLELECPSDEPEKFPFDEARCEFQVESVSYSKSEIEWRWSSLEMDFSPNLNLDKLNLNKLLTLDCSLQNAWRGNHSCLSLEFRFHRPARSYFIGHFLPDILIVSFAIFSCWLDPGTQLTPRGVLLGALLASFFLSTLRGSSSESTALQVWNLLTAAFLAAILGQFILVSTLAKEHQKRQNKKRSSDASPAMTAPELFAFQHDFRRNPNGPGLESNCSNTATIRHSHHHHNLGHVQTPSHHAVSASANAASSYANAGAMHHACSEVAAAAAVASGSNPDRAGAVCTKCSNLLSPQAQAMAMPMSAAASSPFRGTEFSLESLADDTRSINSGGLLEKRLFKDDYAASVLKSSSVGGRVLSSSQNPASYAVKLDHCCKILFPSIYVFFVLIFFCKYLD